jgi:hypothetical protein
MVGHSEIWGSVLCSSIGGFSSHLGNVGQFGDNVLAVEKYPNDLEVLAGRECPVVPLEVFPGRRKVIARPRWVDEAPVGRFLDLGLGFRV